MATLRFASRIISSSMLLTSLVATSTRLGILAARGEKSSFNKYSSGGLAYRRARIRK